ncbi:uncharacterized protein [Mytilus edulis]|uniref:uncharacterized protein n=1 Tax=Mytilus edulis TaxID=6550 RepID=UPI0039EF121C
METDMDTNSETEINLAKNSKINVLTSTSTETDVDTDTNFKTIRARKRALSGQQIQADEMLSSSKKRLKDLKVGDYVIIPVQRVDRGPMDCKNIKGVVLDIAENGYKIGTKVGIVISLMIRNRIEKIQRKEMTILDIQENTEVNIRKAVQLLSLSGVQGHVHCSCRVGCKTGKCKYKKK